MVYSEQLAVGDKPMEELTTRLQQGNLFLRQILEQGRVLYERQH